MSFNYAMIDGDNKVVNIILWDGITPYSPLQGTTLVQSDIAAIGDTYTDGEFIKPPEPTQAQE
jgi:hypothetical protein